MRLHLLAGTLAIAAPVFAQSRQATILSDGNTERGSCYVEVQVDGSAEIQLRSTRGVVNNLAGAAPAWRRYECNSPMPLYPANFSIADQKGRGRMQTLQDPANDGTAIVRIDDSSSGPGVYSFTVNWDSTSQGSGQESIFDPPGSNPNRRNNSPISSAEAVDRCQEQIMQQASSRFGMSNAFFRRTSIDNTGKNVQQVRGTLDVNTGGQSQRYRFNCAVNLNNGRVRSAQIENAPVQQNTRDYGFGNGNTTSTANLNRAIQNCESAVDRRLTEQGFTRIGPGTIDVDDSGNSNRVSGSATVTDRNRRERIVDFACTVTLSTGAVGTVDVLQRR